MTSLILLAGGKGTRMYQQTPKQYLLLAGKPVIVHSLERIEQIEEISDVIIVCSKEYINLLKEYISSYGLKKNIIFTDAGNTRQESVYNGLKLVKTKSVIIHEAARPFVKKNEFEKLINHEEENITFGIDIPFTVLKANEYVQEILIRKELINVQLPQKFNTNSLLLAHKMAINDQLLFTEDASLLHHYELGHVKVLKGSTYNLKITEPIDLLIGEIIYKEYILGRN